MMQDLSVTGHKIATNTYFVSSSLTNAWVVHHDTDLWRGTAPCNGIHGVWHGCPPGCASISGGITSTPATQLAGHERLSADERCCAIFQGFLVTNGYPKNASWPANYTNWLVTNPSYSPEQQLSNSISTVPSPTIKNNDLLRDLFSHVIAATQVLRHGCNFSASLVQIWSPD